jgi:general L-amino acid transport system permease protein
MTAAASRGGGIPSIVAQVAAVGLLIAACYLIYRNTADNLARQGIVSGFDFLWRRAGFSISPHLVDYSADSTFARALLVGVLNTLLLAAISIVLATIIGVFVGVTRLSRNWLARILASAYVEIFRNIPLLLQIFFWYFGVLRTLPRPRESIDIAGAVYINNRGLYLPAPEESPALWLALLAPLAAVAILVVSRRWRRSATRGPAVTVLALAGAVVATVALATFVVEWDIPRLAGFNLEGGAVLSPELVAIAVALSLYQAAFIAETIRGGILSVPRGQPEAARALGLREGATLRLVVLPQALKAILPPLVTIYLSTLKSSSLGAAIGYPELVSVFAGTTMSLVGQAVEIMSVTLVIYLAIGLAISGSMNLWDWRLRVREGHVVH